MIEFPVNFSDLCSLMVFGILDLVNLVNNNIYVYKTFIFQCMFIYFYFLVNVNVNVNVDVESIIFFFSFKLEISNINAYGCAGFVPGHKLSAMKLFG